MRRDADQRFADVLAAIDRCQLYRDHLGDPDASIAAMAYDAILRNIVIHEYFRVDSDLIADIVANELQPLADAIARLIDRPAGRLDDAAP